MPDIGIRATDRAFDEVVKRLNQIYRQAQGEIVGKLDDRIKRINALDKVQRAAVKQGKITEAQYKSWLQGQMFMQKRWEDMLTSVTSTIMTANDQANRIIDGERRAVFGENATYQAYAMEHEAGLDLGFTVYDSATVTRLIREQPELMPRRVIDGEKAEAWEQKKIANAVTIGIITGESIPDIAKRIARDTCSANNKAMVRYARTTMTAAQNAGRIEAMHDAVDMGIKVQKVWIATLDDRTRDAHADLDGQVQEVDKPFDSSLGPIMYPGDPGADEANVWNCRCALGYEYKEYPKENAMRRDNIDGELIEDMSYDEWQKAKYPDKYAARMARQGVVAGGNIGNTMVKPVRAEITFVDAKTRAEAEQYAKDTFIDLNRIFASGVSYEGIGVDVANVINKTITEFYNTYNVEKFGGITAPRGNTKEGKMIQDAFAAYHPIRHAFLINRSELKTVTVAEQHLKDNREQIKRYIANPNAFRVSSQYAKSILDNSAISGRDTVALNVQEVMWHELGHSLEKLLKKTDSFDRIAEGQKEWGVKVSGYATASVSEYIAESFCAWNKGEAIDNVLAEGFNSLRRDKSGK